MKQRKPIEAAKPCPPSGVLVGGGPICGTGFLARNSPKLHTTALASLLGGLAIVTALPAGAVEVIFENFDSIADQALIQTNPSATFAGSALRLVPDQAGQAGSAFFKQGLFINSTADFSTDFTFQITSL